MNLIATSIILVSLIGLEPGPYISSPDSANFWNNTTLATPYRYNIPDAEKIVGLSRLWAEVKFEFSNFDQVPALNWDSVYLAAIPQVLSTPNTLEYCRVLQRMCAVLHDGHTRVWPPEELYPQTQARPPIQTALIQGRVFVTAVESDSLRRSGLTAGLEIVAIDSIPVKQYADSLIPYMSSSTPQQLAYQCYSYFLLRGDTAKPVRLKLLDSLGSVRDITLRRYYSKSSAKEIEFRQLDTNVSYVNLTEFRSDTMRQVFDSILPIIRGSKGLIFDLRTNGGGNCSPMVALLGYLTDAPFSLLTDHNRIYSPDSRQQDRPQPWDTVVQRYQPNGSKCFRGPVAVLTGPATASAAEDFVIGVRSLKRGIIIGETTGGSTGQGLSLLLPGGIRARIEYQKCRTADGTLPGGVGISPDIIVAPTIQDVQRGRDPVLEAAIGKILSE